LLTPDDLGLSHVEIVYLHTDNGSVPFTIPKEIMNEFNNHAKLKRMNPSHLLHETVLEAFQNPSILTEIESRCVEKKSKTT
jgi:DNA topoisomerase IA